VPVAISHFLNARARQNGGSYSNQLKILRLLYETDELKRRVRAQVTAIDLLENVPHLGLPGTANRVPITSSDLAWRWQRLSFSGLPRSPSPFSAPLAYSWLSEICRP
jgi:hypothetical protein